MNPIHERTRGWLVLGGLAAIVALTWFSARRTATDARPAEPSVAHATESAPARVATPTVGPASRTDLEAAENRPARDTGRIAAPAQPPAPASVGGRIVAIDPETGQLGAPSPEQVRTLRLAAGSAAVSRNDEGLVETRLPNGTVILDLDGRFQDYALARVDKYGNLVHGCVHDDGGLRKALDSRKAMRDTVPALEEE